MSEEVPITDEQKNIFAQHLKGLGEAISPFTVALLAAREFGGRPELICTGILFEFEKRKFLVSADHALETFNGRSIAMLAIEKMAGLRGPGIRHPSESIDLFAVELDEDTINELEGCSFVSLERTTTGKRFEEVQLRCIFGFPISKNKYTGREPESRAYILGVSSVPLDLVAAGRTPNTHYAFSHGGKSVNESGLTISDAVAIKGISGGGLWCVPDVNKPSNFYLAGIVIEYHKATKIGYATRVDYVFQLLEELVKRNP